jgi:hypothetical protein
MATPKRADTLADLQALRAGVEKNLATFTFLLAGETYSGAQALAFLDTAIASGQAILTARGTLNDAIRADKRFLSLNRATLKGMRDIIALMYARQATTLSEFGMTPKKTRTPMSNETLVIRAAKARSTRAKRKTLGKRQRAAIKGDVTGVVIAPVTAPAPTRGTDGGETPSG